MNDLTIQISLDNNEQIIESSAKELSPMKNKKVQKIVNKIKIKQFNKKLGRPFIGMVKSKLGMESNVPSRRAIMRNFKRFWITEASEIQFEIRKNDKELENENG